MPNVNLATKQLPPASVREWKRRQLAHSDCFQAESAFVAAEPKDAEHSGLKFVTPAQRHGGKAAAVLAHREAVYAKAKARTPARCSGPTRNWSLSDEVWLNPEQIEPAELKQVA